ncbi:MAG: C-GCAxxG-C-C family protein [Acidobacteriia bacterium]|nr:C-GCAxxG-C-C family protein [Terriglobia bacterium]
MQTMNPRPRRTGDVAVEHFERGYNCAEAIVLVLAPKDGRTPADPQRAATALGGGIARAGLVCGCLSGAAIAVGLHMGRTRPDDKESKERAYRVMASVVRRFEARFGTTECRKLTGLDFNLENPQAERDLVHSEICTKLVRFAAETAAEEIAAAEAEKE